MASPRGGELFPQKPIIIHIGKLKYYSGLRKCDCTKFYTFLICYQGVTLINILPLVAQSLPSPYPVQLIISLCLNNRPMQT